MLQIQNVAINITIAGQTVQMYMFAPAGIHSAQFSGPK